MSVRVVPIGVRPLLPKAALALTCVGYPSARINPLFGADEPVLAVVVAVVPDVTVVVVVAAVVAVPELAETVDAPEVLELADPPDPAVVAALPSHPPAAMTLSPTRSEKLRIL
jgi:hypothetical protein